MLEDTLSLGSGSGAAACRRLALARAACTCTALLVAFTFAVAGVAKLSDQTDGIIFLKTGLGFDSSRLARACIAALGAVEVILAAWMAFQLRASPRPARAALLLLGLFAGLLLAVVQRHPAFSISCPCFGALQAPLGGHTIRSQLIFDVLLATVLIFHLYLVRAGRTVRFGT